MNKRATDKGDSRKVFAHYMVQFLPQLFKQIHARPLTGIHQQVGLTNGQPLDVWVHDIKTAKEAGIDGFALNIGPSDSWTEEQLQLAYSAAEEASEFVLFPSFECVRSPRPLDMPIWED